MKKAKREDGNPIPMSMDRISNLPKDILQGILYFLSQNEAARTSVLSKSWRYNWFTRPNLDFSEDTFKGNKQEFLSIVNNNLQRYCDQRFSLEEFHLRISLGDWDHNESVLLLEKWIPLLTNMGVKDFRLSIYSENSMWQYVPSIVFEAELLQDLNVKGSMLSQKSIERIILLKNLRSLCLQDLSIEEDILQKIISCCPLIESMRIKKCIWLEKLKVDDLHNLKVFSFSDLDYMQELCSIEIHPPSLETIKIKFGNISFHKGAEFRNLYTLDLCGMESSLDNLSSCKFPSLKRLTLRRCDGLKESHVFIDAPNIVYFKYEGYFIPSISFASTTSCEWDSEIRLRSSYRDSSSSSPSSWFLKLHSLLNSLSLANIFLVIEYAYPIGDVDIIQEDLVAPENGRGKAVVVERVDITCDLSSLLSLTNGLFGICRPRNIHYNLELKVVELVCKWKILMQIDSDQDQDKFRNKYLWLQDLEETRIEIKERNQEEWHTTSLSELQNYEQGKYILTRFALKWRQTW